MPLNSRTKNGKHAVSAASSVEVIPITKRSFPRTRYLPAEVAAITERDGSPPPKRVDFQCRTDAYEPDFYRLGPGRQVEIRQPNGLRETLRNVHLFRPLVFEVIDGTPMSMEAIRG